MPQRTNDFQTMVTLITTLLRKHRSVVVTPSAMLADDITGDLREVDICLESDATGQKVVVGIECRAWKKSQSVEWVEAMYGKHGHLPTDALVLVSQSGFTANALKVAEFYHIRAITPGQVTPELIGGVVGALNLGWLKVTNATPQGMRLWVQRPDGVVEFVEAFDATGTLSIYSPDGSMLFDANELIKRTMPNFGMNNPDFRKAIGDAAPGEMSFEFGLDVPLHEGQPVCLLYEGTTIVPVVKMIITGSMTLDVAETPLTHGNYDGTNYSSGKAVFSDRVLHVVLAESDEGITQMVMHSETRSV
ncbi:hypothetical protein MNAB215_5850 [Mycobacterium numidiamassiliense]|uniref:Restriction endonuclease type IV Mrr domain-containing protein n=1 Tax=Mycobacterium numidiamassiliense TaxID=1841861 RepID=A0A2U3PIN3_9MYCO|nr:restriction endonuclease [Mycobacterium numidiamassiliense]SPM43624.1 hypothetical protein MNAB215_5850 [Mycobacterium numidiamassiliense]